MSTTKCCAPQLPRQFGEGESVVFASDMVPKTRTLLLQWSTKITRHMAAMALLGVFAAWCAPAAMAGAGRVYTTNGDVYGNIHFQFSLTTQQITDVTGSGFADRCVPIRRAMIRLRLVGKSWRLNDDNLSLWDFGTDVHSARFTLDMLHRYGVTHLCYVGRKGHSFSYLLADGKAPTGAIEGETCKAFDADRLATIEAQESYALAAGSQTVRTFADKVEADAALVAIMKYRFTHLCVVGENKPSLEYMRR